MEIFKDTGIPLTTEGMLQDQLGFIMQQGPGGDLGGFGNFDLGQSTSLSEMSGNPSKAPSEHANTGDQSMSNDPTQNAQRPAHSAPSLAVAQHAQRPAHSAPSLAVAQPPASSMAGPSSREQLDKDSQQLIDDLNNKRKQDSQLMVDYRKALEEQVQKNCSRVEQTLYSVYEKQNNQVQEKLQELFATLDRIAQLETELTKFKQALSMLYQDMSC